MPTPRAAVVALAALLAQGLASVAVAQTHLWVNASGGCWCTPTNWGPPSLPNSTSVVDISIPGTYTVGFTPGVASCSQFSLLNPGATLGLRAGETLQLYGTTHQVMGVLRIGDGTFGNPAVVEAFVPAFLSFTGTGRIVLNAHPQAVLPFATIRASGRPMTTAPGIRIEGRGALQADLTLQGTLGPGIGPGGIGEIQVDRLFLGASSVLEFDIAGPLFGEADRMQVSFSGARGGTLRVRLAPGYVPSVGQTFTLITTMTSGQFASFDAPGFELFPGPAVTVRYIGTPCDPDVNRDGNADQDDVAYLINVVSGGENPTGLDPDFNHDGSADQDDVRILIDVVAGSSCP